jgi:Tfp pilus assembly protein PilO
MFFGIPEWAIGVGVILMAVSVLKVVTARLMPPGHRPRSMREMMGGETSAEQEEMRARLAELEELKHRVDELEERVDFAERLLARQRETDRLPPG